MEPRQNAGIHTTDACTGTEIWTVTVVGLGGTVMGTAKTAGMNVVPMGMGDGRAANVVMN